MAFKLKSGNKVNFKNMGSSPMRKSPLHEEALFGVDPNEKKNVVNDPAVTETNETETNETETEVASGSNAGGDLSGLYGTKDGSPPTDVADNVADDKEKEKIRAQSKKEMYANAWQDSGIGHIVEAGKSIGRGIKNIRTKNKAKKAEKLSSAQGAVGSGTETLKQAKTVERNRKRTANQAERKAKSDTKDKKKLAKYRKKNPVRGKEAIKLFADQTKKS
tara:strand:+ start:46 stop:702 length:657 start_codon:yes stop_codon:yes gene_type:complete